MPFLFNFIKCREKSKFMKILVWAFLCVVGLFQIRQLEAASPSRLSDRGNNRVAHFDSGRLKVSENGRFLVHDDGTLFFYLGDTAWEFFHRLTDEEAEIYLEDRRSKGFTVIQAALLPEFDGLRTPDPYGNLPLVDENPVKPSDFYFKRVDRLVRVAEGKGLYMALLPTWGDKVDRKQGVGPQIFDESNAYVYGRYLGCRYGNFPNIIWLLGGDRAVTPASKPVWDAMARGIRSVDSVHLISYHPKRGTSSGDWFHHSEWLDFNMCQTGHWQRSYEVFGQMISRDFLRSPAKPCINGEPCYEDHPVRRDFEWFGRFDDTDVRQALYWSIFTGAMGHVYGHHSVWQFLMPEREAVCDARISWREALEAPGAGQVIHARKLMEMVDFLSGEPASDMILSRDYFVTEQPVALRGCGWALVYLPGNREIEVSLDGVVAPGQSFRARWFNPRTGEIVMIGKVVASSSYSVRTPSSGRGSDWVLMLETEC